jgi:hypothetical protein
MRWCVGLWRRLLAFFAQMAPYGRFRKTLAEVEDDEDSTLASQHPAVDSRGEDGGFVSVWEGVKKKEVEGNANAHPLRHEGVEVLVSYTVRIQRSESYRAHFREWRRSQACDAVLMSLRSMFEATFFEEAGLHCRFTREELHTELLFSPLPPLDALRQYFVLDLLLEAAQTHGLTVMASECMKYIIPGHGVMVVQCYHLGARQNVPQRVRSWWGGKRYGASLQLIVPSERPSRMSFTLNHPTAERLGIGIPTVMETFFAQVAGEGSQPARGKDSSRRKTAV